MLRIWDARKLQSISVKGKGPFEINADQIQELSESKKGKAVVRGEWRHGKSVTAGYWDPHGRRIVSTSYDDTIRSEFTMFIPSPLLIDCRFTQYGISSRKSCKQMSSSLAPALRMNFTTTARPSVVHVFTPKCNMFIEYVAGQMGHSFASSMVAECRCLPPLHGM